MLVFIEVKAEKGCVEQRVSPFSLYSVVWRRWTQGRPWWVWIMGRLSAHFTEHHVPFSHLTQCPMQLFWDTVVLCIHHISPKISADISNLVQINIKSRPQWMTGLWTRLHNAMKPFGIGRSARPRFFSCDMNVFSQKYNCTRAFLFSVNKIDVNERPHNICHFRQNAKKNVWVQSIALLDNCSRAHPWNFWSVIKDLLSSTTSSESQSPQYLSSWKKCYLPL